MGGELAVQKSESRDDARGAAAYMARLRGVGMLPPIKNRLGAAALAALLGGVGAHKFYLGQTNAGICYVLFFWTGVPTVIGWVEAVRYLYTPEETFHLEYG